MCFVEPNQFYCVVIKKEDELEDGYHDNSVPEFTGNAVSPDTLSQTLKSEEVSCVSIGPEPNKPVNTLSKIAAHQPLRAKMAESSGDRAPNFTEEELLILTDQALSHYNELYGSAEQQVSPHQKKKIWLATARKLQALGVHERRSLHCRKRWEDLRRWTKITAEVQLGKSSRERKRVRRTLTPLMARILAVAYPQLDEELRAREKQQGAFSRTSERDVGQDGGEQDVRWESEGGSTETEGASGTEGDGAGEEATTSSESEASISDQPQMMVDPRPSMGLTTLSTTRSISTLPSAPSVGQHPASKKAGVSFTPGASSAPVHPAVLSEEAVDLLRGLSVGQTALLCAIQGISQQLTQLVAFLDGIHYAVSAIQRGLGRSKAPSDSTACHPIPPASPSLDPYCSQTHPPPTIPPLISSFQTIPTSDSNTIPTHPHTHKAKRKRKHSPTASPIHQTKRIHKHKTKDSNTTQSTTTTEPSNSQTHIHPFIHHKSQPLPHIPLTHRQTHPYTNTHL
ncbi:myb-related transcription factor, partner of profilin-like isoform X4 [Pleurodeles waltl]|uniref:myb-related transcription factor, partner of profilin-like isoform X4 n=1 Tax=Pleurodeles waltl TaxID=8319 RepID=UPI0037093804